MNPRGRLLGRVLTLTLGMALLPAVDAISHGPELAPQAQAAVNSTIADSPVGTVNDVAIGVDGTLYAVGDFTRVGASTGGFAQLDAGTGLANRGFPPTVGKVYAITPDGAGGYYIGGNFTSVDGKTRGGLARLLANGTVDEAFTPTIPKNSAVYSMVRVGTTLYIGGEFTLVNGTARNRLAAVDTATSALQPWNPGASGTVYSLAADDSAIYVGGAFSTIAGQSLDRVAAFDISTQALVTGWTPNASGVVNVVIPQGPVVYVGGNFTTVGGASRNNLAALAAVATGDDSATSWNPNVNEQVDSLAIDSTTMYVGGNFTAVGGVARTRAAAVRTDDTGTLLSWDPNVNGRIMSMAIAADGVYAGGSFSQVNGGVARSNLAKFDKVTGSTTTWNPSATSTVDEVLLVAGGGALIIGGNFTHVNDIARTRAAAFGTDGRVTPWAPTVNSGIQTITLSGSIAYIGGTFSTVNGVTRNYAAAVRTDDTGTETAWNPTFNGTVWDLEVVSTTVYAVGNFTDVNAGTTRNRAAAVSTTGTGTATPWDPVLNSPAYTVAVRGSLAYLGGTFTTVKAGTSRNRLAAFSIDDTGNPTDWNPNINNDVRDIHVGDSVAYIVGRFTNVNGGTSRSFAAAIGLTGSGTATSWNPSLSCNFAINFACFASGGDVRAVALDGTTAYLGGTFTTVGGVASYSGLVAVQVDDTGSVRGSWLPNVTLGGFSDGVFSVALSGSTLAAGGSFSAIDLSSTRYAANATRLPLVPAAPSAPTGVVATSGNASASIAWAAGSNGGSPVTRVEFALDDTATVDDSTTNTVSPHTISGLTNGTAYTVYVRLINGIGTGDWSVASAPFTPQMPMPPPSPMYPPGSPTAVAGTAGDQSVSVSWSPPVDPGTFPISGYVVTAAPGGRACSTVSTSCTVNGLTNGAAYTFTVTASNAAGASPASAASAPVTPRTIPGSPTQVTATPGDERATITWAVPADDGGSPITDYRVTTIPSSDGCSVTATTCTLTGLTNAREYVVSVIATNAAGSSTPATTQVTPQGEASIVITGTRSQNEPAVVKVVGTITNLEVATVQPYVRLGRKAAFQPSLTQATVGGEGRFRWQRVTSKRITIYVEAAGTVSNRVTIPAR